MKGFPDEPMDWRKDIAMGIEVPPVGAKRDEAIAEALGLECGELQVIGYNLIRDDFNISCPSTDDVECFRLLMWLRQSRSSAFNTYNLGDMFAVAFYNSELLWGWGEAASFADAGSEAILRAAWAGKSGSHDEENQDDAGR